jgi:hypothetical protein
MLTRKKHVKNDYLVDQQFNEDVISYSLYRGYHENHVTCHPGDGLMCAKMTHHQLSENPTDVESNLFGIGSSNMVTKILHEVPKIKPLKSYSVYDKPKTVVPVPLMVKLGERPFFP